MSLLGTTPVNITSSQPYTKQMTALMKTVMRRNGGGSYIGELKEELDALLNDTPYANPKQKSEAIRCKLKDLYVSPAISRAIMLSNGV